MIASKCIWYLEAHRYNASEYILRQNYKVASKYIWYLEANFHNASK